MNLPTQTRALFALLTLGLAGAVRAQPQPIAPPPTNPAPQAQAAPSAAECAKPENKARPDCLKDPGLVRVPPSATDPAIARIPPPTGDPINRPGAAPADQKKETPR